MAQGRLRRLVTRRRVKWVGVPIAASVLVVAVAMVCAVWSPVQEDGPMYGPTWELFDPAPTPGRQLPRALRQYAGPDMTGTLMTGFGFSFYIIFPSGLGFDLDINDPQDLPVVVGRAGFPFRCLRWTFDLRDGPVEPPLWVRGIEARQATQAFPFRRYIPLMPEPVGMVLNILIVSAVIVLMRAGVRGAVVFRRKRKGLCVKFLRLITRRRVKWVATIVAVLTLITVVISMWMPTKIETQAVDQTGTVRSYFDVALAKGRITASWSAFTGRNLRDGPIPHEHSLWLYHRDAPFRDAPAFYFGWDDGPSFLYPKGSGHVVLPAWPIPFLLALVTAYLWFTDRRAKPWQCAKCRYDLRGLDGGVCPECGKSMPDAPLPPSTPTVR